MKEVYNGAFGLIGEEKVDLGETSDHRQLSHKDAEDQHPIKSITGLTAKLEAFVEAIDALKESESEVIRLGRDVTAKITELTEYKEDAIGGIEIAEAAAVRRFVDMINNSLPNTTASVTGLPTGATPTVTVTFADDTLHFAFGLPSGPQGEQGPRGIQGPPGDSYVLTQADKVEIADIVAGIIDNADDYAY